VLWATAKLEDGERSSLTIFEHRIGVIREFVEKQILSGFFVENSKLTSLSFHFLLKNQTRKF